MQSPSLSLDIIPMYTRDSTLHDRINDFRARLSFHDTLPYMLMHKSWMQNVIRFFPEILLRRTRYTTRLDRHLSKGSLSCLSFHVLLWRPKWFPRRGLLSVRVLWSLEVAQTPAKLGWQIHSFDRLHLWKRLEEVSLSYSTTRLEAPVTVGNIRSKISLHQTLFVISFSKTF